MASTDAVADGVTAKFTGHFGLLLRWLAFAWTVSALAQQPATFPGGPFSQSVSTGKITGRIVLDSGGAAVAGVGVTLTAIDAGGGTPAAAAVLLLPLLNGKANCFKTRRQRKHSPMSLVT